MKNIEKHIKVKRKKYLSESDINKVIDDFKDTKKFAEREGRPIDCMCIISSAGLCGSGSSLDYMLMITSALVSLIKDDVLDIDDLSIIFKSVVKALEGEHKDKTEEDFKKLISALNDFKELIKTLKEM